MTKKLSEYEFMIVEHAATLLNISTRLVRRMISEPCPDCEGPMIENRWDWRKSENDCKSCLGTGRRLPAFRFGSRSWYVLEHGLTLDHVKNRRVGRPAKKDPGGENEKA